MAKGITEATIEEIKARVDLVELISSYGISVKTAGASKKACCPFHHEKTPSFHINETKGFYHCFGCGESGDAIKFVEKMEGSTFVEAVKKLAEKVGVKIEEQEDPAAGRRARLLALLAELAQFYRRCLLKAKEGEIARAYLQRRALTDEIQADYLIGYAPNGVSNILKWGEKYGYSLAELEAAGVIKGPTRPGDSGYHRFGGRLMFSIRDKQGRVVGFSGRQLVESKNSGKYVNSPETLVFKKSKVLYGFDKAASAITKTPNHEVIVCEGQIDCIRLQTSGFPNAVAGQGTAFTEEHVRMLKRAADQVVLVYDDDGAGHKATVKSARLCLAAELPVRVVSLPGGDDPDSFLRTHPADEFRALLENAESIMSFQVRAEREKERNPNSIDAVNRIAKEILQTISTCPSAILRATMMAEAAKLLGLPESALQADLSKRSISPVPPPPSASAPAPTSTPTPTPAEDAIPPPAKELAFCEFLFANEDSSAAKIIKGRIVEFLPAFVFSRPFTRQFVETWCRQVGTKDDLLAPWGDRLESFERVWFDRILLGQAKDLASTFDPAEVMEDYVRDLWSDYLKSVRGNLAATGDPEAAAKRLRISIDLKRLRTMTWSRVKDFIQEWIQTESTTKEK